MQLIQYLDFHSNIQSINTWELKNRIKKQYVKKLLFFQISVDLFMSQMAINWFNQNGDYHAMTIDEILKQKPEFEKLGRALKLLGVEPPQKGFRLRIGLNKSKAISVRFPYKDPGDASHWYPNDPNGTIDLSDNHEDVDWFVENYDTINGIMPPTSKFYVRPYNWAVDQFADSEQLKKGGYAFGDVDGRIDHFLTQSAWAPDVAQLAIADQICCPITDWIGGEDSIRDLIQNRLGAIFFYRVMIGKTSFTQGNIETFINNEICAPAWWVFGSNAEELDQ